MLYCQLTPPRLAGYLETNQQGAQIKVKGATLDVRPLKFSPFPLGVVAIRGRWAQDGSGKPKSEMKWLVLIPWSSAACDGKGEVKGAALYEGYMPGKLSWGDGLEGVLNSPAIVYGTVDKIPVRWGWMTWEQDGEKTRPVWKPHPEAMGDIWVKFTHVHAQHSREWLEARTSAAEVRGWLAAGQETRARSAAPADIPDFGGVDSLGFGPPPGAYTPAAPPQRAAPPQEDEKEEKGDGLSPAERLKLLKAEEARLAAERKALEDGIPF